MFADALGYYLSFFSIHTRRKIDFLEEKMSNLSIYNNTMFACDNNKPRPYMARFLISKCFNSTIVQDITVKISLFKTIIYLRSIYNISITRNSSFNCHVDCSQQIEGKFYPHFDQSKSGIFFTIVASVCIIGQTVNLNI